MKQIIFSLFMALSYNQAWAHGGGESRVSIEPEAQGAYTAGKILYSFQLYDEQTKKGITDKDLVDTHTKKIHLVAYDSSLNEFNHVHPAFDGTKWTVELNLPVNGKYFIWTQGQLADGAEFSSNVPAIIESGKPSLPVSPLGDHRKGSDLGTIVELSKQTIKAGQMVMLDYKVTREDGQAPVVTPYLGALAHVIAVSPDGDELIHVHPMDGGTPDTGMLHSTFPTAGDYRVWIQLIDRGTLKTVALSVTVSN